MTYNPSVLKLSKIVKRLELIKNLILLEEETEINSHISKLEQHDLSTALATIITFLKEKHYNKAVMSIEAFINQYHRITIYSDPEIDVLKFEIKSLEAELNALSNQKAEAEKLIHEFNIRHNHELGEILIKILIYRKEKAQGTSEQQEAENDYNTYQKEYETTKEEQVALLADDEQKELKAAYRKASKLCHPDVINDEQKEQATKLFAELSTAYDKNDLKRVKEILENLENGNFFVSKSDAINQKQLLKAEMENLRLKIAALRQQLCTIKESEIYSTICNIDNWDEYFIDTKQKLQQQLSNLKNGE